MNLPPLNVLGLMSGTSLDGVDGVLVRLECIDDHLSWEVLARDTLPYSDALTARLKRALKPETSDVLLLTQLHTEVAHVYADLACSMTERNADRADLIALSGQTVYHIPRLDEARGWRTVSTLQLGEASIVAERCALSVFSDFRQSDMAAGGGGAPLVAFGDLKLYQAPGVSRSVHNLGGISNLTYLPADADPAGVFAFDTGPANCLIDEAATQHFGVPFDKGGALAAQGRVNEEVLTKLMAHPYLGLEPPKTTGRETFNLAELERDVSLAHLEAYDLLATLTAFTAVSIAQAYKFVIPKGLDEILLAGGGAHNETLVTMLQGRLNIPVKTFEEVGWHSKDREALAFAVMGYYAHFGLPNTLPSATGARHPVIAGKLSRPWQGA